MTPVKATPVGVAYRGPSKLLAEKPWAVPIPGTTKLHHVEENALPSEALEAPCILDFEDSCESPQHNRDECLPVAHVRPSADERRIVQALVGGQGSCPEER